MKFEDEYKNQLKNEIAWLEEELKNKMSQKKRKEYLHQIKKKEYDLALGVWR